MSKRRGLGSGLEQLIPTGSAGFTSALGGPGTRDVPIALIEPNPEQPRSDFDPESLRLLAESIAAFGVLQPVVVEASGERFNLIAGERRLRAAQLAGLGRIPAVIRPRGEDRDKLELALVENLQRSDLPALDEARAYARLCDVFGMTQEEVGRRVGKSRPAVANTMRLLQATPAVQLALQAGEISPAHARALLGLGEGDQQGKALTQVVGRGLSVRNTERLVARLTAPNQRPEPGPSAPARAADLGAIEDALTQRLSTRVRIQARPRGRGRIVIEYFSDEELNSILERLGVAL
ncbi:MAG: ParB/RepB/Spo0J family partition protein [Candidatus Dormibacteria bacterium]